MAAFFRNLLHELVTPAFLEGVRKKYHFGETQIMELQAVAEEMAPWMRKEAFWERKEVLLRDQSWVDRSDKSAKSYERVVMTLGHGIDCLQETYSESGWLLQSYMTEVLAGEILYRGYDAYQQYIRSKTGWYVANYHFPGSEDAFPLELLADLLKGYAPRITCNSAFCMSPSKSVVFISELTEEDSMHGNSICAGCTNRCCIYRSESDDCEKKQIHGMRDMPMTYGYSQIFGSRNLSGARLTGF